MDLAEILDAKKRVKENIKEFEVPEKRRGDLLWLKRNLWIWNHGKLVDETMKDVNFLVEIGITKI